MISISDAAKTKVREMLSDKEEGLALRLYITTGGCSGFSYGMALDKPNEDDESYQVDGLKVVVAPDSTKYVDGAEVDYVDNNMGAGFKINNPNAISTCGCGSSFRTAEEAGAPGSCE